MTHSLRMEIGENGTIDPFGFDRRPTDLGQVGMHPLNSKETRQLTRFNEA